MALRTSAAEVVNLARTQIGTLEGPPNSNDVKYTRWHHDVGDPWCNVFVDWVLNEACARHGEASPLADVDFPGYGPAYTGDTMRAGQQGHNGMRWVENPVVGALPIYDWNWDGFTDHIGIVSVVHSNAAFAAVEGNTSSGVAGSQSDGGGVFERERSNVSGYVRGFVTLPYGVAPPPTPRSGVDRYLGFPTLREGNTGAAVQTLQSALNVIAGRGLVVDGSFGPATLDAVRDFQHLAGVLVDGEVGPVTWHKLGAFLTLAGK